MTTPRFALEQFLIRHKLLAALEGVRLREIGNMVNETVRHDVGLILLLRLKHLVSSQIDWEESTNASRVCVRARVDDELDNLKHIYNGIDAVLVRLRQFDRHTTSPTNIAFPVEGC